MKKMVKIRALTLSFVTLMSYSLVFSQSTYTDSLQILLSAHPQNDTIKVNLLNALATQYRISRPDQVDSILNLAIAISDELGYISGKGNALAIKGMRYYGQSNFHSARLAFEEAKQLLVKASDKKGLVFLLRREANLDMDEGNYAEALQQFLRGLSFAQQIGDKKSVVDYKRTMGYLFNVIGQPEKAIGYQNDALEIAKTIRYESGMAGAYNAIGKTYKTQGNWPAALNAYQNSLLIDQQRKDSLNMMIDFANLADVYERSCNYRQAMHYIMPPLIFLRTKNNPNAAVAWEEWILGKVYLHSGNADSGLYYGKHSLELSNKINLRIYISEITQLIAESAAKLRQFDTAYKYEVMSSAYRDSLTGQETARKTTMLQAQIELDKRQSQIALLTKEQQLKTAESKRQRLFLYSVLSGLALLLAFSTVLYRNNRLKQRANVLLYKQKQEIDNQKQKVEHTLEELRSTQSQLIQSEKEKMLAHHNKELLNLEAKALRAQMNPHFIYNCMNSIKALIQNDDKSRSIVYLTTFSKLIRTIFQNSDKRQISLYDEIETCKLYTQLEAMRLNGKLNYIFSIDPNLDLKSVMVPALIVQPFIENAIWHGILPKGEGLVNISIKGNQESIFCEVDDNGIGRETSKLNKPITPVIHESKGVHLSQQRLNLEKLLNDTNASIEIIDKQDNNIARGTKVLISFNLN